MGIFTFALTLLFLALTDAGHGQQPDAITGARIYAQNCAACHGVDGRGAPADQRGFNLAMPDFTDCSFASREGNSDWIPVATRGGPTRAFSTMMPAMGEALSEAEIKAALAHVRTFCTNKNWPRGELNYPRPLYTTKAFPEDEYVISATFEQDGLDSLTIDFFYEKRFGARNQWEVVVPYILQERPRGPSGKPEWDGGLGDIALAVKRVLYHKLESGTILSAAAEVILPTGDEDEGFGSGTTVVEPFVAVGQAVAGDYVLQVQAGGAVPMDGNKANEELFGRAVFGRTWMRDGYGRAWSPMVGLLASKELIDGAETHWDIAPQLQVSLSTRQHVRLGLGARIPLTQTDTRGTQYTVYLLWDWFDGWFLEGW